MNKKITVSGVYRNGKKKTIEFTRKTEGFNAEIITSSVDEILLPLDKEFKHYLMTCHCEGDKIINMTMKRPWGRLIRSATRMLNDYEATEPKKGHTDFYQGCYDCKTCELKGKC